MGPALPWRKRYESIATKLGLSPSCPPSELARALESTRSYDAELETLRFNHRDLVIMGSLESGQFGAVDVVKCRIDQRVYIRKTVQKSIAERHRDNCFVQFERDLLLRASQTQTPWAPHLLCAFQSSLSLDFIMDFAEGGTLWDVLEFSNDSRLNEADLRWWVPQAVSAISWCHSQGFAHRDIKPQNFVLTQQGRLQLIDFGCAAPLLPANASGVRSVMKPYCLVPCGTCDYLSPEILQAHEDALFAAEVGDDVPITMDQAGYGCETDWWSLGAVMYELAMGVAPFFANDIKQTYSKIVEHERSELPFNTAVPVSNQCKDLISRFLSTADERLGRTGPREIQRHPWFAAVQWSTLHLQHPPANLLLPRFTYGAHGQNTSILDEPSSSPFDFSHLFRSSPGLSRTQSLTPGRSIRHDKTPGPEPEPPFAGFTWGPSIDAFDHAPGAISTRQKSLAVPSPFRGPMSTSSPLSKEASPRSRLGVPDADHLRPNFSTRATDFTPGPRPLARASQSAPTSFQTPMRPILSQFHTTIPRTSTKATPNTSQRMRRPVSDREALRQMLVCVGASARKKVLESGRKPRISHPPSLSRGSPTFGALNDREKPSKPRLPGNMVNVPGGLRPPSRLMRTASGTGSGHTGQGGDGDGSDDDITYSITTEEESAPPSPSPRPGSALSRRSGSASPFPFVRSSSIGTASGVTLLKTLANSNDTQTQTMLSANSTGLPNVNATATFTASSAGSKLRTRSLSVSFKENPQVITTYTNDKSRPPSRVAPDNDGYTTNTSNASNKHSRRPSGDDESDVMDYSTGQYLVLPPPVVPAYRPGAGAWPHSLSRTRSGSGSSGSSMGSEGTLLTGQTGKEQRYSNTRSRSNSQSTNEDKSLMPLPEVSLFSGRTLTGKASVSPSFSTNSSTSIETPPSGPTFTRERSRFPPSPAPAPVLSPSPNRSVDSRSLSPSLTTPNTHPPNPHLSQDRSRQSSPSVHEPQPRHRKATFDGVRNDLDSFRNDLDSLEAALAALKKYAVNIGGLVPPISS